MAACSRLISFLPDPDVFVWEGLPFLEIRFIENSFAQVVIDLDDCRLQQRFDFRKGEVTIKYRFCY